MRLLLDTHFVLWITLGRHRLTRREQSFLEGVDPVASSVSLWELRLKWDQFQVSGDRKGAASPRTVLAALSGAGRELLPLTPAHAAATLATPIAHKDPFDELLLVQAQEEGLRFLTRDRGLAEHPLIWRED